MIGNSIVSDNKEAVSLKSLKPVYRKFLFLISSVQWKEGVTHTAYGHLLYHGGERLTLAHHPQHTSIQQYLEQVLIHCL